MKSMKQSANVCMRWLFDVFWFRLVRVYHEAQGQHLHCLPCHLRLSATSLAQQDRYLQGGFPVFFSFRPLQAQLRDPWSRAPACCNLAGQLIWLISAASQLQIVARPTPLGNGSSVERPRKSRNFCAVPFVPFVPCVPFSTVTCTSSPRARFSGNFPKRHWRIETLCDSLDIIWHHLISPCPFPAFLQRGNFQHRPIRQKALAGVAFGLKQPGVLSVSKSLPEHLFLTSLTPLIPLWFPWLVTTCYYLWALPLPLSITIHPATLVVAFASALKHSTARCTEVSELSTASASLAPARRQSRARKHTGPVPSEICREHVEKHVEHDIRWVPIWRADKHRNSMMPYNCTSHGTIHLLWCWQVHEADPSIPKAFPPAYV